jgi:CubicO group peptidase (beta-lactamase class C family)
MRPLVFLALTAGAAAQYFPPPDAAGGWRTLTRPAEIRTRTGIDTARLDEAFDMIQGATANGGLLVVRHGWLVYERYFGRASRDAAPNTASCGKAFTSIAMGILMAEKPELFPDGLDQRVMTPRYLPPEAFPLNDPAKQQIKLGQLLSMTSGLRGNSPGFVNGKSVPIEPKGLDGTSALIDRAAYDADLWCKPGEGYSYATVSPHLVSIIVRHLAGKEMQQYLDEKVARPLGWGKWGFGYMNAKIVHTPGGGGIQLRATDMLRFAYMLLHDGRWAGRQVVPADYVRRCLRPSPYNPHFPYSLQFELNSDGHVAGAPRDAVWKQGSGGHCFFVVPSLDLVIWKLGGRDGQYGASDAPASAFTRRLGDTESNMHALELVVSSIARPGQ